ncbi:MAG: hypothetical protein HYY07_03330 [Elusimicrobia bacterium]|nr:hypothetical protein [Elusimicrobiota bacterium]MBI4218161.1 hypothetical protein [Elusimicrobiota bacterium]
MVEPDPQTGTVSPLLRWILIAWVGIFLFHYYYSLLTSHYFTDYLLVYLDKLGTAP